MYAPRTRKLLFSLCGLMSLTGPALADPADDQYAVAARHYERSRWQLAVQEFRTFLEQHPAHPRAAAVHFFLGESLVQASEYPEAKSEFQSFLASAPEHQYSRQAQFRLGELAFLEGDLAAAKSSLEIFEKQYPGDPLNAYVLPYLGEIELSGNNPPRAQRHYLSAIQRFPAGPLADECRFGLARVAAHQGKLAEAMERYTALSEDRSSRLADVAQLNLGVLYRSSQDFETALQVLDSLVRRIDEANDLLIEGQYWRGETLRDLQRWGEAEKGFRAAAEMAGDHRLGDAITFSLAETLRTLARDPASPDSAAQLAEAAELYRTLIRRWPSSQWADDALQILAQLAFGADDHSSVQRLAAEFLNAHAGSELTAVVQQTLARSLIATGKYVQAIEILETVQASAAADADENPLRASPRSTLVRTNSYFLALAYLGDGRHADALSALELVNPTSTESELAAGVAMVRGSVLVALRRHDEAVDSLRAYLSLMPDGDHPVACRAKLVAALGETGRFRAADTERQLLQADDRQAYWQVTERLARIAASAQEWEVAVSLLTELSASEVPGELRARSLRRLGKLYLDQGDAAAAEEALARVPLSGTEPEVAAKAALWRAEALRQLDRDSDALNVLQAIVDMDSRLPQAASALFEAAQVHSRLGRHRDAKALLQQLVDGHPQFAERDAALYLLAWSNVDLEQQDRAERVFQRLADEHEQSPYRADALFRLAKFAVDAGDLQRAGRLLDTLLQVDSEPEIRAHALYLKGQVASQLERWDEVLVPLEELLNQFPDSPLAVQSRYWSAEALFRQEQWDRAELLFRELDQDKSIDDEPWANLVPLRLSQLYAQQKNWHAAYTVASQLQHRFPDFEKMFEVDYVLGRCLAAQARFREAREAYQRVVHSGAGARSETAAMAQWMIGESFLHQKKFTEAIKAYHRVETLYAYPKWQAAALLQAAKCHEQLRDWRQAVRLYAQLLQQFPDSPFATEAAERLETAQRLSTVTTRN